MQLATPTLLELQRSIARSLTQGEDHAAASHIVHGGVGPAERLSIYRNTFQSTLVGALRLSFPAVQRLVGAEFFEGAARLFIKEQLPRSAYLDDYGADFPEFLAKFAPAASLVYLPEVARLEWTVNRVLHAPDVPPFDVRSLLQLQDTERACVQFAPVPSVALARCGYPADVIWRSVLEEEDSALAAVDLADGPVWLLVQRLPTGLDVRRLGESGWCFSRRLFDGLPLHAVLDEFAGLETDAWIAEHLATGRLASFSLADSTDT